MKSVLRYPGAKWSIASWIIDFFPKHHSYLEPFFGSGAVLFTKDRSNIETINDLDGEVVNLFECIRNDPEQLAHQVYFTPYSRQVYDSCFAEDTPADRFTRAARLLAQSNMSHGFRTNGRKVGWKNDVVGRERAYAAKNWVELPGIILDTAERLRGVQIECSPAAEVIVRFNAPDVLVYCDPPYVLSTRGGKQYRHEMTEQDHIELLAALLDHKGPVILSGYPSEIYDRELKGWSRIARKSYNQNAEQRTEVLWCNFTVGQKSLFDMPDMDGPSCIFCPTVYCRLSPCTAAQGVRCCATCLNKNCTSRCGRITQKEVHCEQK